MIFKLAKAAEKAGVASMAHNQLPKVILGVEFADGIEVIGPHMCIAGARHHIRVRPVLRIEERTD